MVHRQDNDRLRKQGVDVDKLTDYVDTLLNGRYPQQLQPGLQHRRDPRRWSISPPSSPTACSTSAT